MLPRLNLTLSELEKISKDNLEKIKEYRYSYSDETSKKMFNSLSSGHGYKALASYWSKITTLLDDFEISGLVDNASISKGDQILRKNAENRIFNGRTDKKDIIAINEYLDELTGVLYCKFQYLKDLRKFTETKQLPYFEKRT